GRRRMPRADREEQMLGAATRIFARRGYQDASMDEIAAACGITKPMLYSYFDSKEGLFLACLDKGDERLRAAVRDAVEGATGAEQRLWRGLVALFRFFEDDRDMWALGYRAGPGAPSFAAAAARSRQAMVELLTEVFVDTAVRSGVDREGARGARRDRMADHRRARRVDRSLAARDQGRQVHLRSRRRRPARRDVHGRPGRLREADRRSRERPEALRLREAQDSRQPHARGSRPGLFQDAERGVAELTGSPAGAVRRRLSVRCSINRRDRG